MRVTNDTFVSLALDQADAEYRFGAEWRGLDPAEAVDCSELIEGVGRLLKVSPTIPDGSWLQYRHVDKHDQVTSVAEALNTRGALLFRFRGGDPLHGGRPSSSHVAISLGDGRTMEARSRSAGVGVFGGAASRDWTHAGLIPGVSYLEGQPLHPSAWDKAIRLGITNGDRPRDHATREEVAIMAMRAARR